MNKSALVIFKESDLDKGAKWWKQFDAIIAPHKFKSLAGEKGLQFVDIATLLDAGSVEEAAQTLRKLSLLTVNDKRISKTFKFKGFELWWIRYGDLMHRFCFPYTQYRKLLSSLSSYASVTLYHPPSVELFEHFLTAHGVDHEVIGRTKSMPALGVFFQLALSTVFLPWALIRRSKVMVWTSDLFDPPRDHDFRMRYVYEELYKRKIPFVEFIRSLEPSRTVISHALTRKRPVIYSSAVIDICHWLAKPFNQEYQEKVAAMLKSSDGDQEKFFWLLVTTHYLQNLTGTIWSIKVMKTILQSLGVKAAVINDATSRTFYDVLACKLLSIPVIGIMHGAASQYYNVSDFSPEFDGERNLFVDKYGVWSEGWREYYLKYSGAYKSEQLVVSGPMRPLERKNDPAPTSFKSGRRVGPIKVLLVPGQLSNPQEVMPYLLKLMEAEGISIHLTFRPYRDEFEKWINQNHPQILEKIGKEKILLGDIQNAIAQCDVVVGSYSTATLEALLQLKPILFFRTNKWGDYFSFKGFDGGRDFFAENPEELVEKIKEAQSISQEIIKDLQKRFFGDPHENGSKWVVDQVEFILK